MFAFSVLATLPNTLLMTVATLFSFAEHLGLLTGGGLLPGTYSVDIEKAGFKKYSRPDVVVQVNQTAHIDAAMQIGDVSQTVEVTAETPLLQSETSSLGTVVETREANAFRICSVKRPAAGLY